MNRVKFRKRYFATRGKNGANGQPEKKSGKPNFCTGEGKYIEQIIRRGVEHYDSHQGDRGANQYAAMLESAKEDMRRLPSDENARFWPA